MQLFKQFMGLLLIVIICSCGNKSRYPYAINDFNGKLQPHLVRIVEAGIVSFDNKLLQELITDRELVRLSRSEHPILRAVAFQEIMNRKSFDHLEMVNDHLDDTAIIAVDKGEFGIRNTLVSDYILQHAYWKTMKDKNKTVERVLSKHNYLSSAYLILVVLDPQEKYYSYIRDMAGRPQVLTANEENKPDFNEIEQALYGLAKFRKKEDVTLIRDRMINNLWRLSGMSFQLMKEFPDTAYLDVLQKYHQFQFYRLTGNSPYGFSGGASDMIAATDFTDALVAQQNERSAALLDSVLTFLPQATCMNGKETTIDQIIWSIWKNPCPAYTRLRERIKIRAKELDRPPLFLDMAEPSRKLEPEEVTYRWYP